jgi:S-adenosylmethionine synthetase
MTDKVALVTGATGLLGRQVLAAFQKPGGGWQVKGSGHSRADGEIILKIDLQSEGEVEKVLDQVK